MQIMIINGRVTVELCLRLTDGDAGHPQPGRRARVPESVTACRIISERARWVACLLGRTRGHVRRDIIPSGRGINKDTFDVGDGDVPAAWPPGRSGVTVSTSGTISVRDGGNDAVEHDPGNGTRPQEEPLPVTSMMTRGHAGDRDQAQVPTRLSQTIIIELFKLTGLETYGPACDLGRRRDGSAAFRRGLSPGPGVTVTFNLQFRALTPAARR